MVEYTSHHEYYFVSLLTWFMFDLRIAGTKASSKMIEIALAKALSGMAGFWQTLQGRPENVCIVPLFQPNTRQPGADGSGRW